MKPQTFTIMVSKSPFDSRNAESAIRFCHAAVEQGHNIYQVFFYQSGVHNASVLLHPNSDEIHVRNKWIALNDKYNISLNVCVTAAARRGVLDQDLVEGDMVPNLVAPFRQVGLSDYFESIANGHKSIQPMTSATSPYILIQTTKAPYSTSASVDALEAAMAASNIGLQVKFVFVDDGVYQLLASQDASLIEHKNIYKRLKALPMFDIEDIYAQETALTARSIDINTVEIPLETIDNTRLTQLCEQAQQILVF